ncbi:uncharacterized protein LOC125362644 [Perognathus longimembris pacificus]|uniref:uncharacterized protein LOC125362644 n=1 Tax=Perognathus longimembris pacificus TaxID=214514 RepID=UPI002018BFD1|nr:uncharacterized protein LOC125362644 [Perognathus longimembris pacificus]
MVSGLRREDTAASGAKREGPRSSTPVSGLLCTAAGNACAPGLAQDSAAAWSPQHESHNCLATVKEQAPSASGHSDRDWAAVPAQEACHHLLLGREIVRSRKEPPALTAVPQLMSEQLPRMDVNEDGLASVMEEASGSEVIMAGTLQEQVERLRLAQLIQDSSFIYYYLDTYRMFQDTQEVVDLLFSRFWTFEAPMGCSGRTAALPHCSQEMIPRDQRCYAISGLINTWLDRRPQDFLEAAQHPCLQRLRAQLRLHMCGSELERHVSHLLAQLGIQESIPGEATAPAAAALVAVTPTRELASAPSRRVALCTLGGTATAARAQAPSALNPAGRRLGAQAACVDEEPRATPALLPRPEGARAARGEASSSPTWASELSGQGPAAAGAELEPSCSGAPGLSGGEAAVRSGEMQPCFSLLPVLGAQPAPEAIAEAEPASTLAPLLSARSSFFTPELELLMYLALLLFDLGAPAALLCGLAVLALLLCAMQALGSRVPSEPASPMARGPGADGAPAWSAADREPCASGAPMVPCSQPASSGVPAVDLIQILALLVFRGPEGMLSDVGVRFLMLHALRSFNSCAQSESPTSLALVHSAQGALGSSVDDEASLPSSPPLSLQDPDCSADLEVLLSLSVLFYRFGAPAVALFVVGFPAMVLVVVRAIACHAGLEPSATWAQVRSRDEAPSSRPAVKPRSSSAPGFSVGDAAPRAELDLFLPAAAVLALVQTPILALCVGGALAIVLLLVRAPICQTPSGSAQLGPHSSMVSGLRREDTAASGAKREGPRSSTPVSGLLCTAAGNACAPGLAQDSAAAWSPQHESHNCLATVKEQAPSASGHSDRDRAAVPAQEACHHLLLGREIVRSRKEPPALTAVPQLMSEQLPRMDVNEDGLASVMEEASGSEVIMAGTLQEQVERLRLAQLIQDSSFIYYYLDTYRMFQDTQEVVDLLFSRFWTFEAPMGCSGRTAALPHCSQEMIPRDQRCYAISGLINTWLDRRPQDFLEAAQHPCLQRLRAQLRLHMCGSELERHVSHLLAQLGIQESIPGEATAPAAAALVAVTPTRELASAPSRRVALCTLGGTATAARAQAPSALNPAGRRLGAQAACVDEEPRATPALLPRPEGARAARGEASSSPTWASELSGQGPAAAGAELEPSCSGAPGLSGGEAAVRSGEMQPCFSLLPVLGAQPAPEAIAEAEPASTLAPLLSARSSFFTPELELLMYLALLLFDLGAPAALLCGLAVLALLLCAMQALGSRVPSEPASPMARGPGADGAPAWSAADREPCASGAPMVPCSQPASSGVPAVDLIQILALLVFRGPEGMLSDVGVRFLMLHALRSFNSCAQSESPTSLALVHSAQGALGSSVDDEASLPSSPPLSLQDPDCSADLEVLLSLSVLFYRFGAPAVALFVVGFPAMVLVVVRAIACHAGLEPSATWAQVRSRDEAPSSRPAVKPRSSSAPGFSVGDAAPRAELDLFLPAAAVLALVQTPILALCVGGALAIVLLLVRAPICQTPSGSAQLGPHSSMVSGLRREDTAASGAKREGPRSSTPVSGLLCTAAGNACAPGLAQDSAAAWSPQHESHNCLATVKEQAPSASGHSDRDWAAVPAQEACHHLLLGREIVRSRKEPPALTAVPQLMSEQLPRMDVNEDGLASVMEEASGSEVIMAGTLQEQVERLRLAQLIQDSSFIYYYLDTYRMFQDTQEVVDLLFSRFWTFEAPMGCSGRTAALPHCSQEMIPRDQRCYAISGLINTWLDRRPQDFLEAAQHPCLQRLRAQLRLHMCGSELERHVSHLLAQLGIQESIPGEATAPAAAALVAVTPTRELASAPSRRVALCTLGGTATAARAQAPSALNPAGRRLGAQAACVDEEPRATPALLPRPEGARAARGEASSSPTWASELSGQGPAAAGAELEPSCSGAPGLSGGEAAVRSGEMQPCFSLLPVLGAQPAPEAIAEAEPASTLAPLLSARSSFFTPELELLMYLALLLFDLGAPAALLCGLAVLALLLCAMQALGSRVPSEPASPMARGPGADGAPAWSAADREPCASGAPMVPCSQPASSGVPAVDLIQILALLVFRGPEGMLSDVGVRFLMLHALRSFNSCAQSESPTSLALVHSAQGALGSSVDDEASLPSSPPLSLQDPDCSADLEVLLSLSVLFYRFGAPAVALFVVGFPAMVLVVVRAIACHAGLEPSATWAQVRSRDEAPSSRPAVKPRSSSAPGFSVGDAAPRAELDLFLPAAAVLALVQTPILALCVGGALAIVLLLVRAPICQTPSGSAQLGPHSSMVSGLRREDTAASGAKREGPRSSTPVSGLLCTAAGNACAPGLAQDSAAAWSPQHESHNCLATVKEQAPSASGHSDRDRAAVPAQEACHHLLLGREIVRSRKEPPALTAVPQLMSEQLPRMDVNEDGLASVMEEASGSEVIMAGTLQEQVERLRLAQLIQDSSFIYYYLDTYRMFQDTQEVVDLLFSRFWTFEAPMGCSGRTAALPHCSQEMIPRDQRCYAISGLINTWLDRRPQDFLEAAQHPCLQRLRAQLRLHMCGSELERHVSHLLAQLGIQESIPGEATAPAAAALVAVTPTRELASAPSRRVALCTLGGTATAARAQAPSALNPAGRRLGAQAACVDEEPRATPALLPRPEGARAARGEASSSPTWASELSGQGPAAAGAELEPSCSGAPGLSGGEAAVRSGEMQPCFSLLPVLGAQPAPEAIAEAEPASTLAPLLSARSSFFTPELELLMYLALLLFDLGAPAALLCGLAVLALLLCAMQALGSRVPSEPASPMARGPGADGAPAWSAADREPCASGAPMVPCSQPASSGVPAVDLIQILALLVFRGPEGMLSDVGVRFLMLHALRSFNSCAQSESPTSLALVHSAQGALGSSVDDEASLPSSPPLSLQDPDCSADLEVLLSLSVLFYRFGAPAVALFVVGFPAMVLVVVRAIACHAGLEPSATWAQVRSRDEAPSSRPAVKPRSSSAPGFSVGDAAPRAELDLFLPAAAVLALVQTPILALCVGGALAIVLLLVRAPICQTPSGSAQLGPHSSMVSGLRREDTAASGAKREGPRSSTPVSGLLCTAAGNACAPGLTQDSAAAWSPQHESHNCLATVKEQAPCASGHSDRDWAAVPAQKACHHLLLGREIVRSRKEPPALTAVPQLMSEQLPRMDVAMSKGLVPYRRIFPNDSLLIHVDDDNVQDERSKGKPLIKWRLPANPKYLSPEDQEEAQSPRQPSSQVEKGPKPLTSSPLGLAGPGLMTTPLHSGPGHTSPAFTSNPETL